jgi:hypothetical protein
MITVFFKGQSKTLYLIIQTEKGFSKSQLFFILSKKGTTKIMSHNKPTLVKFSAYYLLTLAGFFGVITLIAASQSTLEILIPISFLAAVVVLFIASGIGLLRRKKWARIIAIISFSLILLSTLGSLNSPSGSDNFTYNLSFWLTKLVILGGSALGLYALTADQSVKSYFD